MKIFSHAFILISAFAVALTACSKKPPNCSDEETTSLVKKIIIEHTPSPIDSVQTFAAKATLLDLKIESARASAFDENINKYTCNALLNFSDIISKPITYESQLDDNNEHIVMVNFSENVLYTLIQVIYAKKGENQSDDSSGQLINSFVGSHPAAGLDAREVKNSFKVLLGDSYDDFTDRLDLLNVSGGIRQEGGWIVGEGGMPPNFTTEAAAYAINIKTREVFSIMLKNGKSFKIFGATVATNLPAPLLTWYNEHNKYIQQ